MTKFRWEQKTVWVDNTDEAIKKRILWMMQRGWDCVPQSMIPSNSDKVGLLFRRQQFWKLSPKSRA